MAKTPEEKPEEAATPAEQTAAASAGRQTRVRWDAENMATNYANVCNVSSTREEVTLLFGTNQTWHTGQTELTVQLSNRIVLNPFAAKRMSILLNNVLAEYESRFGKLVDAPEGASS